MNKRIDNFVKLLINKFPIFLKAFEDNCPFKKYGQLEYHVETISKLKILGSARAALNDRDYLNALYKTLLAWGIGSRRSSLRPFDEFSYAFKDKGAQIADLQDVYLDQLDTHNTNIYQKLSQLMFTLDIVENKAKLVANTKALHHLLPELVVPIDRAYTQEFFGWQNPVFQYNQEKCFEDAFRSFIQIAKEANPSKYVGDKWNTSQTKIIDNAIVGVFCGGVKNIKKATD